MKDLKMMLSNLGNGFYTAVEKDNKKNILHGLIFESERVVKRWEDIEFLQAVLREFLAKSLEKKDVISLGELLISRVERSEGENQVHYLKIHVKYGKTVYLKRMEARYFLQVLQRVLSRCDLFEGSASKFEKLEMGYTILDKDELDANQY